MGSDNSSIAQKESNLDFSTTAYMAETFTLQQVRHELTQAERKAEAAFDSHDTTLEVYWKQFAACCREALDVLRVSTPTRRPGINSRVSIDDLKARYDLVDYIGQYTKLRKSGARFYGLCPLHADKKSESLVIFPDQHWHCFGACNTGGDLITFVMKLNSTDVKGAIALLDGGK
jgi:hypothetical protein